jgi:alanyl-tRNA synthetase
MLHMSERLYYADPYLREFDATVVERPTHEGKTAVILDRTAFYPTSGGQPFDVGTLSGVSVIDVIDTDDGRLLHVVDRLPDGDAVKGAIGWTRRFDHMQQHTGQHVLSAAFDRFLGARTESFHLGADYSTIDLARDLTATDVARAEAEANRVVWEDRPVAIRFVSAEEAAKMGLRKESRREGTLRLIDVQDFDLSACGGTHVARTGAIGIIAVSATERFRGGLRVTFLCGGRALTGFRALRDTVAGGVRALSVLPAELPAAIERLQGESRELRRQIKDLQGALATHEGDALAANATDTGGLAGRRRVDRVGRRRAQDDRGAHRRAAGACGRARRRSASLADRRRARRRRARGCRRGAASSNPAARRQGRRTSRARAGRRPHVPRGGRATVRARLPLRTWLMPRCSWSSTTTRPFSSSSMFWPRRWDSASRPCRTGCRRSSSCATACSRPSSCSTS